MSGRFAKMLPNLLSATRLALSPALVFVPAHSTAFFVLYALCGLTDLFDGLAARRLNAQTRRGAALDSAADTVLAAALLAVYVPLLNLNKIICIWICAIAAVKALTLACAAIKFRTFGFVHTLANKAVGLLLFCTPLIFLAVGGKAVNMLLCGAASLAAAEELCIVLLSESFSPDTRSVVCVLRQNKAADR